jgi:hypothetical protein
VAWRRALASLSSFNRTAVEDNAGLESYEGGTVRVVVRSERQRGIVREKLKEVDFSAFFQAFQRLDVSVSQGGRVGRELRAEADDKRREDARRAAEASPVLKRLIDTFGARIEAVEPLGKPPADPLDELAAAESGEAEGEAG